MEKLLCEDLLKYQNLKGITVHQSTVIAEQLTAKHCSRDMKVCVCIYDILHGVKSSVWLQLFSMCYDVWMPEVVVMLLMDSYCITNEEASL